MSREHQISESAPEAQGIPSAAILAFVDAVEQSNLELHSLMLLRHGHMLAQGWWAPYQPDDIHMLFSLRGELYVDGCRSGSRRRSADGG